jgi:dTDP-4-dehydrorhamnose reductase
MDVLIFGKGQLGKSFLKYGNNIKIISKKFCDITDPNQIVKYIEKYKPNKIINTAAITDLDYCEKNKKKAWITNVYGAYNVAKICKKYSIFSVQISSDNALRPINEYAFTKKISEKLGFSSVVRIKYFSSSYWLIKKLNSVKTLNLLHNNKINPIYLDSVVETIMLICRDKIKGQINLGCREAISHYDLAKLLCKKLKKNPILNKIDKVKLKYPFHYNTYMSTVKLKQKLKLVFRIEDEVDKYVKSIKKF